MVVDGWMNDYLSFYFIIIFIIVYKIEFTRIRGILNGRTHAFSAFIRKFEGKYRETLTYYVIQGFPYSLS